MRTTEETTHTSVLCHNIGIDWKFPDLWRIVLLLLLSAPVLKVSAQNFSITGTLQSTQDSALFSFATVLLQNPTDSSILMGSETDLEGAFRLAPVRPGKYLLHAHYIGYAPLTMDIDVLQEDLLLGKIFMEVETEWLNQIEINAKRATGTQRGDTTQFDAAAFVTMQDASAQNLIEKLPGVNTEDGSIQAEGENVVQILVDGKPFFGQDVKAALQNLPAEVVESVQIYDKQSDKAEMSGFDDGEHEKTINIITKPNRRRGQFGKISAGYGSDNRYMLGSAINFFNEHKRVTVTALSNNINALGYSADANSQGESRPQSGIIKTQGIGINFSDDWGEKIEISGSYQFSHRKNEGNSLRIRDYVLPESEGQTYRENDEQIQRNQDHGFSMRLEYNPDKNNRLIFRPHGSVKNDKETSYFFGRTAIGENPLNQTENNRQADNDDYDFGGRLFYSHRFPKKGRSFNVHMSADYHSNADDARRQAVNTFYSDQTREENLNQYTTRDRKGHGWSTDLSYTEPMGKNGQFELEYEISKNLNTSDRLTFDVQDGDPGETKLFPDTALSNTFDSDYLSHELELGYQYRVKKFRLQLEVEYQRSDLLNDQQFPQPFYLSRIFENLAPTVRIDLQFSKTKRLDLDYDTYNRAPSIGQLQDVIDITNPLRLRTGNPALDQTFTNRIRARYRSRDPETDRSFFAYLSGSLTDNYITNSTFIADQTVQLEEGIVLEKGSQLSAPVNLDGYVNLHSYFSFGRPLRSIKSNGKLFGSMNFVRRPGMINEELNFANNTNLRIGFSVSSNISENIDFNFSTSSGFNVAENTLRPHLNNNYFSQSTRLSYDWIIWDDLVYRLDLNHRFNDGLAEDLDNHFLLLNMSIGTKILSHNRGELSLNVYDLFRQNNNIQRNVTELYIEDSESNVLQRYFILTFHYNLRHFNRGTTIKDYKELHGEG